MPHIPTTPQRSYNMSRIRAKDTKPELLLRKALWARGIRYRTHAKDLPGRPDIVIRKYRLAIFVDGEFWHGHQWEKTKGIIKSNRDFWIPKIERNIQRDKENNAALIAMGYTIFRFWARMYGRICTSVSTRYSSTWKRPEGVGCPIRRIINTSYNANSY